VLRRDGDHRQPERALQRNELAHVVPLDPVPDPLQQVADRERARAPIPIRNEQQRHARERDRDADHVNPEVRRRLVPVQPVAPRAPRERQQRPRDWETHGFVFGVWCLVFGVLYLVVRASCAPREVGRPNPKH
jgi:hypothetical protein